MSAAKATKTIREMIQVCFGVNKNDAESHILTGKDDPGGWSPDASTVIHAEYFNFVDYYDFDSSFELTKLANENGVNGHFEWVNAAVLAFYED